MSDNTMGNQPDSETPDLALTWAALLAHWTDLARAGVALPPGEEGDGWRASLAPAITLQAVAMALGEIERLDADERHLALDRAEILIERESDALSRAWARTDMPRALSDLLTDAQGALAQASAGGGDGPAPSDGA